MSDQVPIIVICLLYTFFWHYSDLFNYFGPEKLRNVCLYVSFFDINIMFSVSGSMLHNIAAKTG